MATDGSNRVKLTELSGAFWNSAPRFHPSGEKIYFQAGFNADDHLAMINPDGTGWTDITEANVFGYTEANIFFNADGTKISFFTTERVGYNNGGDLVIADADGSNWNYLSTASNGAYYYQASFHPTNDLLYITHMPSANGKFNIYTMNQDGTNMEPLTNCSLAGLAEGGQIVGVELSPNPAKDMLTIEVTGIRAVYRIEMISLTGQMLQAFEWESNQRSQFVDISVLPDGVYFCRILGESKTVTRKLMIVR
jgi:Tol biopolymer transport system component